MPGARVGGPDRASEGRARLRLPIDDLLLLLDGDAAGTEDVAPHGDEAERSGLPLFLLDAVDDRALLDGVADAHRHPEAHDAARPHPAG